MSVPTVDNDLGYGVRKETKAIPNFVLEVGEVPWAYYLVRSMELTHFLRL